MPSSCLALAPTAQSPSLHSRQSSSRSSQATSATRAAAGENKSSRPRRPHASEASAPISLIINPTQSFAVLKSDSAPPSNSTTHFPADVVNTALPAIKTGTAASSTSLQPTTWWPISNFVLGTLCAVATLGLTIYRIRLARKRLHAARRTETRSSLWTVTLGRMTHWTDMEAESSRADAATVLLLSLIHI